MTKRAKIAMAEMLRASLIVNDINACTAICMAWATTYLGTAHCPNEEGIVVCAKRILEAAIEDLARERESKRGEKTMAE